VSFLICFSSQISTGKTIVKLVSDLTRFLLVLFIFINFGLGLKVRRRWGLIRARPQLGFSKSLETTLKFKIFIDANIFLRTQHAPPNSSREN